MYIPMHICICVCISTHNYVYIYIYIHTYIHTCIYIIICRRSHSAPAAPAKQVLGPKGTSSFSRKQFWELFRL